MCGFDSIPADLGTLHLVDYVQRDLQKRVLSVKGYLRYKASISGGTAASMLALAEEKGAMKAVQDPYYLNPRDNKPPVKKEDKDRHLPSYDRDIKSWVAPFVMAIPNTRVVRRSNALLGNRYGKDFHYNECERGSFLKTFFICFAAIVLITMLSIRFCRNCVMKRLLPSPGQGPSAKKRATFWFHYLLIAKVADDSGTASKVQLHIKGGDPGYTETAKMVAEAALCLATQRKELEAKGGVLTPASAMGQLLVSRLDKAGIFFNLIPPK